ncbi:hypothetical protein MNBD_ALPHA12-1473 [hydrothermal vent metagenome]|uniref:Flagellar protein FlgN n=1 Tax=hydrothermal vent metagenome TaxID=652676 RepID=A0A3B0U3W2_9ZZZZ
MSASNAGIKPNQIDARSLCTSTKDVLDNLVDIMNQETVFLRAGHYQQASEISAKKAQIAQQYVALARQVQNEHEWLMSKAPQEMKKLVAGHEKLTTQMAENLRVLATARDVTQTLLSDVAVGVGRAGQPNTYGASGQMNASRSQLSNGIAINRAL